MDVRKKLDEIKELWGFDTDLELANGLETAKHNIDSWVKRGKIPEKWEWKIGQMSKGKVVEQEKNHDDIAMVSYYPDINAAGGYGAVNGHSEVQIIPISKNFLNMMFGLTSYKELDIIRVIGDSMEPYIPNGETIILQRTSQARNNQIVVARIGDEIYVKRLLKDPMGEWIKLTSENQYYPDIDIKKKDMHKLEIIGIVHGKFRPF